MPERQGTHAPRWPWVAVAVPFSLVAGRRTTGALHVRIGAAAGVAGFWALAALPLLLIGFTSFLAQHRTVGSVAGKEVVLRYEPGFQDAGTVQAGYRNGPWVDFRACGDTILGPPPGGLASWRVRVEQTSEGVAVRYRTRSAGSGTLMLDPPPSRASR